MIVTFLATAALALLAPVPSACGPPAAVPLTLQDDEVEVVDKRPEVAEKVATLNGLIQGRGEKDTEAIAAIDALLIEFPQSGPKDQAAIIGAVERCLDVRRLESAEGVPDNRLYLAAATALGEMGSEAGRPITKWIGHKRHRGDLALQRRLVLSLGKLKDTRYTKDLSDLLQHKDAALVAAASEAMANFATADQRVRKSLFEDVMKGLMSVKGRMDTDPNDLEARERYNTIAGSMNTTLQVLSGEQISVPEEWQRWWNKNKRDDWDEEQS